MSKAEFWDRVTKINAGMLDANDGARLVPMSHHADPDANTLWFITAQGTDVVDAVDDGAVEASYIIADNGHGLHAHLKGALALSQDRAKLEELWGTVTDAWFDGGIDDPDVRLLSFKVESGEVWATPTSGIAFIFNVAKAKLTGDQPDMGEHFML